MNANRYMRDSLRTADRSNMDRLKLECALGLCGEAGEVAEQVKKHFFHGHELDKRHMIEELGDVAWYLAVLCDAIGSDLDTVMEENLKKLEQRYPEGFDPYRSQHRNEFTDRMAPMICFTRQIVRRMQNNENYQA